MFCRACFVVLFSVLGTLPLLAQDVFAGFVDSRQMLLNHPLFRQFDLSTHRFLDTPSAWVANPENARVEYKKKIASLEKGIKDLDGKMVEALKVSNPQQRKDTLDSLLREKSELKIRIVEIQKAIEATKVSGNYLLGAGTGVESLVPVLKTILGDIRGTLQQLSLNGRYLQIWDLAAFGNRDAICDRSVLFTNYQFALYGSTVDLGYLKNWLRQFRIFLKNKDPKRFGTPFLFGFKDLRNDSLRLMTFGAH